MFYLKKIRNFYREAHKMSHFPSILEVIVTRKRIFSYYGFLGDNNFGDELVYEATKHLFEAYILIPIKRKMPVLLRMYCFLNKSIFSGVVIGGGTLIGPFWEAEFYESLRKLNIPVYIHGTGVHEKVDSTKEWGNLLSGKVYGGVRGPLSKSHISPIVNTINIAGDAAFSIFNEIAWENKPERNKVILVNLGAHYIFEGQNESRHEVEKFLDYLLKKGYTVKFLPFHNTDLNIGKQLIARRSEISLIEQPQNYEEAVELFQNCSFVIGERLHFIVMAVLTKSPFISINYSRKHDDFLASIDIPHAGLRPVDVSQHSLLSAFEDQPRFNWDSIKIKIEQLKGIQTEEFTNFLSSLNNKV